MAPEHSISTSEVSRPTSSTVLLDASHYAAHELAAVASDPALTGEFALALLKRPDLPGEVLARVSKNGSLVKLRKVKLAVVEHAKTPRHIAIPLLRQLFTFDLMRVAILPTVPADIKRVADEALISRLETIPSGERLSLAKRASGRVAAALLLDSEERVVRAALENSRLTEASVIAALTHRDAPSAFVQAVCHQRWSLRREVRVALLRNEKTPLARALEFAQSLPAALVREALQSSRLPENIKALLIKEISERTGQQTQGIVRASRVSRLPRVC